MLSAQTQIKHHRFQVIEKRFDMQTLKTQYIYKHIYGSERTNNSLNRLSILSENQYNYPVPESSCGPTAMLNILIWYEKYGLITPFTRSADTDQYKQEFFKEIDRRILKYSGRERTEEVGTYSIDTMLVMDELVNELSNNRLRLHSKTISPPLKLKDFKDIMPNFRAGYLVVQSRDAKTKQLRPDRHAVTFIRADRAGYITLGTWGQIYRGILKKEGVDQWFIPSNPEHRELKIINLIQFIPFEPKGFASPPSQSVFQQQGD